MEQPGPCVGTRQVVDLAREEQQTRRLFVLAASGKVARKDEVP